MARYPSDEGSGHGRVDLVLFLGVLALSAVLVALPASQRAAVSDLLRRSVLRPFVAAHQWGERQAGLQERLRRLEGENRQLQQRILRMEGTTEENRELRDLLSLGLPREPEFISADIVLGTPGLSRVGRFQVDVGRSAGVSPPAGVVVARGVVGIVRTAEAGRSYGDLWTHPDFRVSVRTDSGDVTGVVRPAAVDEGGTVMLFEGAPYQRRVPGGTVLVTTGAGGVFPPGVPVGRVRGISSVESGWARSYRVEPVVRPQTVHSVLVWARPADARPADSTLLEGDRTPAPAAGPDADTLPTPDSTVAPRLEPAEPAGGAAAPAPSDTAGALPPDSTGGRR